MERIVERNASTYKRMQLEDHPGFMFDFEESNETGENHEADRNDRNDRNARNDQNDQNDQNDRSAPPGRDRSWMEETRRLRNILNEIAENFVCTFTQELIFDPVMGEDGFYYERSPMQKWIQTFEGNFARSPRTNVMMGKSMVHCPHVRHIVGRLVWSGALPEDLSRAWRHRKLCNDLVVGQEAKTNSSVQQVAAAACMTMGGYYLAGSMFLEEDRSKAFSYFQRAAWKGSGEGALRVARSYHFGCGVPHNLSSAIVYYTRAAMLGNDEAKQIIAEAFFEGRMGIEANRAEGVEWGQVLSSPSR